MDEFLKNILAESAREYAAANPRRRRVVSASARLKLSEANRDKQRYIFLHMKTHQLIVATRAQMLSRFGLTERGISEIISGKRQTTGGWVFRGIAEQ